MLLRPLALSREIGAAGTKGRNILRPYKNMLRGRSAECEGPGELRIYGRTFLRHVREIW